MIKLQTANGQILEYYLSHGRTADMIHREINSVVELRDPASPLPPTPVGETVGTNPHPLLVARDCGTAPALREKPFWIDTIVPPNPEDDGTIYRSDADLQPYLKRKREHIQEVLRRKPSKRFHEFIDVVKIEPTMVDTEETPQPQSRETMYRRPRLSTFITEQPTISTNKFTKDNVESTLAECLKKVIRRNFGSSIMEDCPIGLTSFERETFCWRLDLVENSAGLIGWKAFARHVMLLDNDDLEMLDEFSCKYKCQVVEVILDHWYKLYKMNSQKCLYPATKDTIIHVLKYLERDNLLGKLNWLDE